MYSKVLICFFILITVLPNIDSLRYKRSKRHVTKDLSSNLVKLKRKIYYKKPTTCSINFRDRRKNIYNDANMPMIYFVTPTYPRPEQTPELIRQAHTLMHVPRVHWIVADDKYKCSRHVLGILRRSGLPYTHIASPKPNMKKIPEWLVPRGVSNRRAALDWIRQFVTEGVIYFGDDDNTVDLELFDEIRKTKGLSMFPVGLIDEYGVSSPVVRNGKVVGFFESWTYNRKFPVDMAGFAVNVKSLNPTATMPYKVGFIENEFLKESGFDIDNIEPLANNCTKVLVWHTKTVKNKPRILKGNLNVITTSKYHELGKLLQELTKMEVLKVIPSNGTEAAVKLYHRDRKSFLFLADIV